jgi:hypothetical protein
LRARLQRYFDGHPEVSPRDFFVQAVQREIGVRERLDGAESSLLGREEAPRSVWLSRASTASDEAVRLHTWLNERLLAVSRERQSVWGRTRQFFRSLLPWDQPLQSGD